ncbi:MAG: polyamine aminopropyltransferase [Chitinivorax sp.]
MALFGSKRVFKARSDMNVVDVSETRGIRSLHLGTEAIQSSMKVNAPFELVLEYSRCMLGFMLFHPQPREILLIGLGGGSIAKWTHKFLPQANTTAVEINPQVIAVARSHFFLPANDERLNVMEGDGAAYVAGRTGIADVLLVDGYDSVAIAPALDNDHFYRHCYDALTPDGVMVANLWGNHKNFDASLQRIDKAFNGLVCCLPARSKGNIAVMAFKKSPGSPKWETLRERARELENEYRIEFAEFVGALTRMNPHTDKRLML